MNHTSVIWQLVLPSESNREKDFSINLQERRKDRGQQKAQFSSSPYDWGVTQQRHLDRITFLLGAVESAKIRCSCCCLVIRE